MGRLVALTLTDGSRSTGRLVAVSPDATSIEVETTVKGKATGSTVALSDVKRAVVEVEFSRNESEED